MFKYFDSIEFPNMRKFLDCEQRLISLLLSKCEVEFNQNINLSDVYVIDLSDGGMGSLEFLHGRENRDFGAAILDAVAYDIDHRKIFIQLSIDTKGNLYQLDAFTEDYLPLKASLGTNLTITDFHSPPIYRL
jgi:predicted peptidase